MRARTRLGAIRKMRGRARGQALVEFSLVLIPFLLILMGIADLGRGNGLRWAGGAFC